MLLMTGKPRAQIRLNIAQALKDTLDAEMAEQRLKPGQLATMIFEWYLQQPSFLRALIRSGPGSVPDAMRNEMAKSVGELILGISSASDSSTDAQAARLAQAARDAARKSGHSAAPGPVRGKSHHSSGGGIDN